MSFRVIVAGGQDFHNYALLEAKLTSLLRNKTDVTIISAKAKGADTLAERYALEHGLSLEAVAPNWNKYHHMAWRVRNAEMAKSADALVAFFNGHSKGTKHMIDCAKTEGLNIRIIYYQG